MQRSNHFLTCVCLLLLMYRPGMAQKPQLVAQLGHSREVKSAIFSPDGKLMASNGAGGIIIWHASTGRELRRIAGVFSAFDFAPDSKSVAAAVTYEDSLYDKNRKTTFPVEIFDVGDGRLIKKFPTHKSKINSVKFSADGKFILTASDDRTAKLWNAVNGTLKLSLPRHGSEVSCAVFSPDNKFIATAGGEMVISECRKTRLMRRQEYGKRKPAD